MSDGYEGTHGGRGEGKSRKHHRKSSRTRSRQEKVNRPKLHMLNVGDQTVFKQETFVTQALVKDICNDGDYCVFFGDRFVTQGIRWLSVSWKLTTIKWSLLSLIWMETHQKRLLRTWYVMNKGADSSIDAQVLKADLSGALPEMLSYGSEF